MTKIVQTPDWWYHDDSCELDDDHCHHGNFYEDCELCVEEGETEEQEWELSLSPKNTLKPCTAPTQ